MFSFWFLALLMLFFLNQPCQAAELVYHPKGDARAGLAAVATSNGKPYVTKEEMDQANSLLYYNLANQLQMRQRFWLRVWIGDRLLEAAALKQKISVDELLKKEAPPEPITAGVIAQFLAERDRVGGTVTDAERKFLEDERLLIAKNRYIEKLWREAKIEINLPDPEPPRVLVSEGNNSPVLGIADGPVNLIEFCAFTSVPCKETWKTLHELVQKYGWRLRIVHRDYPLPNAPESMTAAIAARCAQRQDKFWQYHDYLYEHQNKFDDAALKEYAKQLGLDTAKFNTCFDNKETAKEIEYDLWEGKRVQLPSLPGLFANTIYFPGGSSAERLKQFIQTQMGMQ